MAVKQRLSVYLDADMMARLEKLAEKERAAKSSIAEAAIISFLTADDADRREAALTRRLDRLTRSVDRVERDLEFSVEALALYIRAWLTATPPLPDGAQAAAQAKGRERYESFIEALGEGWRRDNAFLGRCRRTARKIRMAQTNSLLNCKRANLRPPPHNAPEQSGCRTGFSSPMMAPSTVAAKHGASSSTNPSGQGRGTSETGRLI